MRLTYLFAAAAMTMMPYAAEAAPHNGSCHTSIRTHGGAYPEHYHSPGNCVVIYVDDEADYDDCHHSVLRHFLPGYGKTWHRHVGPNCNVQIYEEESGPTPGVGGCIQIGPSTICGFGG